MKRDISDIQIHIDPESLADLVHDLHSKGFNEQQVRDEVERIKQMMLADIEQRLADDDEFLDNLPPAPLSCLH